MRWVTARQVDDARFTRTRWRRGYDEDEVDGLLDEVAGTLADMAGYIAELEAERDELREDQVRLQERGRASGQVSATGSVQRVPAPVHQGVPVPGVQRQDGGLAYHEVEAAPLAPPYPQLAPEVLASWAPGVPPPGRDVAAGSVSGPRREPEDRAGRGHAPERYPDGRVKGFTYSAGTGREGCPCRPDDPGHPGPGDFEDCHCRCHDDEPEPEPRSLADELGQEVEAYVHDEHRRAEARRDSATWQTAMDLEHAEWLRRVGMDAPPIEWSTT